MPGNIATFCETQHRQRTTAEHNTQHDYATPLYALFRKLFPPKHTILHAAPSARAGEGLSARTCSRALFVCSIAPPLALSLSQTPQPLGHTWAHSCRLREDVLPPPRCCPGTSEQENRTNRTTTSLPLGSWSYFSAPRFLLRKTPLIRPNKTHELLELDHGPLAQFVFTTDTLYCNEGVDWE